MPCPRQYLIVRWCFGSGRAPSDFPICEQCYGDAAKVADDIWNCQVEHVAQVVAINLDAGTARDVTAECFVLAGHDFHRPRIRAER